MSIEDTASIDIEVEDTASVGEKRKVKAKSWVWNHFSKKKINGEDKAICHYCGKDFCGGSGKGTSHLGKHYKRCPTLKDLNISPKKKDQEESSFNPEIARNELAKMIILHEYPLSIVDHIGLKRYSTALQPSFKVVSRNTIKEDIMKIYESEKEVTMKFMEDNKGKVAITTDMWTASNQKKGFMAITAHYIDASWTLQSRILRFVHVLCPHTKEKLCQVLFDCLLHWDITKKISTVTFDNCSTNDAMIDVLLEKLDSSSLILAGSLIHMRCAAHVLNLVVKAGLQLVKSSVDKIRESVVFWKATPKREEKFEEAARHLLISYSKKLVLDVATRWNSTYLMLEIAIIYKSVFARLLRKRDI
ncbi:zinc finger BED domain-containing protein RICESLEEPER 2-like [Quillaja saponaria]|uniref:Zinc finger BED domain-containing protein RICESLEEPER 2-like n=1 Tax=Quillaja saponaria TaxID=32244 RepID=A0AAD7L1M5_QUISA|nr:zinc finger BED domain-containing protein RICESLEEPER 2-like [Quillaja saponaria]